MVNGTIDRGKVGLFWVVEEDGTAVVVAHDIAMEQAERYGDMLTIDIGHLEYWSTLARRGARSLREAGLPSAPVWSEYEEWPRGRVLYYCLARRPVIRADKQLHHPAFVRLIADKFCVGGLNPLVLPDDHYRSIRRVPVPLSKVAVGAARSTSGKAAKTKDNS